MIFEIIFHRKNTFYQSNFGEQEKRYFAKNAKKGVPK
jgi:hypothetical protein